MIVLLLIWQKQLTFEMHVNKEKNVKSLLFNTVAQSSRLEGAVHPWMVTACVLDRAILDCMY